MLEIVKYPNKNQFSYLSKRPVMDNVLLMTGIQTIFDEISRHGDKAILNYTEKFDSIKLNTTIYDTTNLSIETLDIPAALKASILVAYKNIYTFHSAQIPKDIEVQTMEGVHCTQTSVPINKIGIYIPGGSAPLFSTVLMLAVPAQIAGCKEIILCTPPNKNGEIDKSILFAALICGIGEVRLVGGAQAIAALTIGTKEIPKVDKIFGPGNQYVTAAKQLAMNYGVAIDMPAGPSEVLVFADNSAIPSFVAADLLAQAEHGADSQVIVVSTSEIIIDQINGHLEKQLETLPRKNLAQKALENSKAFLFGSDEDAFDFINHYAPEHLIVGSEKPEKFVPLIFNAGSVFLGNYCPESAGDYASGTNHTLPTNGWARSYSGVNIDTFMKKITMQRITKIGIQNLGDIIMIMAEAENLVAHARAVQVRLDSLV